MTRGGASFFVVLSYGAYGQSHNRSASSYGFKVEARRRRGCSVRGEYKQKRALRPVDVYRDLAEAVSAIIRLG